MRLIESKAEYIPQEEGLEGIYKQVELAGRTAYHSQDKITPTSAKGFVDRMIKSKHGAALEHGTVYLKVPEAYQDKKDKSIFSSGRAVSTAMYPWLNTPYCKINTVLSKEYPNTYDAYITTNLRYIWEHELGDMQGIHNEFLTHMYKPTEFHEKRYTMRFTCDRGVSHQTVRERLMSFLQESQRYCCYIKEKFGVSVTFIQPSWIKPSDQKEFEEDLKVAEQLYFKWLNKGYKAEEARYFLINGTKTEIIVTGFASDWRHMIDLRYFEKTGKVSPDMKNLMQKAQKAMQEAGIWEDIMSKPSKFD